VLFWYSAVTQNSGALHCTVFIQYVPYSLCVFMMYCTFCLTDFKKLTLDYILETNCGPLCRYCEYT